MQLRSRMLRVLFPLCVSLAAFVAVVHWQQQEAFLNTQFHWQEVNDQLWAMQPDRHPHRVAHYGSLAFRLNSPLSFLDAGANPYLGNVLFLEAHRQNSAALRQFIASARELGLGYFSVATIILILWPLVLIALAHGTISDERSGGNLALLLSLGATTRALLAGKWLAYFTLSVVYLCCLFLLAGVLVYFSGAAHETDIWWRLGAGFLVYSGYCAVWVSLIQLASFFCRSSPQSLLLSLGIWVLLVVLFPKTIVTVAELVYPTQSRTVFDIQLEQAIAGVGDSHNPDDPHFSQFKAEILKKYQVDSIEDLPVNWRGVVMQEGERIGAEVFNRHYQYALDNFRKQDTLSARLAVISPYAIAALLSSKVTGNDTRSYYAFEQQAEAHRYEFVRQLNELHAHKINYHNDRQQRISNAVWSKFDDFKYRLPNLGRSLQNLQSLWLGIGLWLVFMVLFFNGMLTRYQERK